MNSPWYLLQDAGRSLGWKFTALLIVIPIAGLLEGFSLTLLMPLMVELGVAAEDSGFLYQVVKTALVQLSVPEGFGPLLVLMVVALQVQVGTTLVRGILEADLQNTYMRIWQQRLFEAFATASWAYSMQQHTAAQSNAILTETGRISTSLGQMIQIIGNAVLVVIYAVISLSAAWQVVLLLGGLGTIIFFATRPLTRRGGLLGQRLSEAAEAIHHATNEFLSNMKLLKTTATEQRAIESFAMTSDQFRLAGFHSSLHPRIVLAIYMSLGYLLLGAGIYLAIDVLQLSAASIVVSIYVFLRLYVQVSNLQQSRQSLAICLPGLAIASELLARARAEAEAPHDGQMLATSGPAGIQLENVEVRYGETVAIRDLIRVFRPGAVIGLTGPSGAGKSTFVDVVAGLVTPVSGRVAIDGVAISQLNLPAWRRSIGYVAQETLLLRGTVRENIAWSMPGAADEEVHLAAKLAHADGFIQSLPHGYETPIGDRGVRLSGGQRQRLGLARALLGHKRLLILDEATSALDSESEAKVLQAVNDLRGRVTIIMIAHRLSTLRLCDEIVVLENGKLVESGSFAELLAQGAQFARLWRIQSEQGVGQAGVEVMHGS